MVAASPVRNGISQRSADLQCEGRGFDEDGGPTSTSFPGEGSGLVVLRLKHRSTRLWMALHCFMLQ
jgi:hypothetical protein